MEVYLMEYSRKLYPYSIRNKSYHLVGGALVIMNYFRHLLAGYKTPRTFSIKEIEKTLNYDLKIVDRWNNYLSNYSGDERIFKDKVILELGVGPDLGTGVILLAKGARKYFALDVNNLAESAPDEFYDNLINRLSRHYDVKTIKEQIGNIRRKTESRICYIVDKEFRISVVPEEIDIVVSQAAFEHFDNIEETIAGISKKVRKGGILIAHVDMNTHTRWIKDRDPLNIYRYGEMFWKTFKFRGSPNRIRITQYKKILEQNNWTNIKIEPRTILEEEYAAKVIPTLNGKFRKLGIQEMKVLSCMLIARRN